ncbi:MAG: alkaline phosphatase PhoX [Burkholderiales bacterium]
MFRRTLAAVAVAAAFCSAVPAAADSIKAPSSSATPYYVNVPKNVDVISLLTVGDSVNEKPDGTTPYRMVGIPDGLGAFDNDDGTFTVLMNHELGATAGAVRQHGQRGAFISAWTIRKSDLTVLHGGDFIKQQLTWNPSTGLHEPATTPMGRLCSADLPKATAFYNSRTDKGYSGRIFMNGEELGAEGRAFAHIVTGPGAGLTYELPSLGKFSWENSVASPYEQDKTVVIGLDDTTPGQVYVYIGQKQHTGSEIEKAGLHGGWLYGIKVNGIALEDRAAGIPPGTRFSLHNHGDVRTKSGAQLQAESSAAGVTEFLRPEDGAWDTRNPNVVYFVTTDRYDSVKDGSGGSQVGRSRLYRLTFDSIRDPEIGGRIDMMIDGTGSGQMFDNITVDADGNVLLQEDPGNQAYSAKIWKFYPQNRALVLLAKADPDRFGDRNGAAVKSATPPFTQDEESSGIIEVTQLFTRNNRDGDDRERNDGRNRLIKEHYRYYLGVVQAHYPEDAELVEGGQLFLMGVPRNLRP